MPSFHTVAEVVGDVPRVIRVELPEGTQGAGDWAPCFDLSALDNGAYEWRWFEGFRARWQRALLDERWNYRARLERAVQLTNDKEEQR